MIDPELKIQLDTINENLKEIEKKSGTGLWKSFFSGIVNALGYVVGLAIVVVIVGWILQKTGLLPSFENQVKNFTDLVNGAKQLLTSSNTASDNKNQATPQSSRGETTVTLPNGQQVKVNIPVGY